MPINYVLVPNADGTQRTSYPNGDYVRPEPGPGLPTFADRTHTVTATASGSGDGSASNPWTLQQAVTLAGPGMVVGVAAGVYIGTDPRPGEPLHDGDPYGGDNARRFSGGFNVTAEGTAESPIYFVAENPAALSTNIAEYSWIRSGATNIGRGWASFSVRSRYVQLIGFYISDVDCTNSNAGDDSGRIVVWGSNYHDIAIRYCRFLTSTKHNDYQLSYPSGGTGNNDSTIRMENCYRVVVADCYFEQQWVGFKTNQTYMTHYEAYYITIEHCHFKNGTCSVFQKRGFATGQPMLGVRFRFNISEGVAPSVMVAGVRDDGPPETERSYYYCNLFLQPRDETFRVSTDGYTGFSHDGMRWFNNTVIGPTNPNYGLIDVQTVSFGPLYGNPDSPNERINVWFNNVVEQVGCYSHLGYGSHGGEVVDHAWWLYFLKSQNNVYETITDMFKGTNEALVGTTWEDLVAAGGEVNSIKDIALQLDSDYRPLPGSPCIGAGRDLFGTFGPVQGVINAGCYPTGSEVIGIRNG